MRAANASSNIELACDAARAGIGIAEAFSYYVADLIKCGELVPLLQGFQPPPWPLSALCTRRTGSCRSNCAPSWISRCRDSGRA